MPFQPINFASMPIQGGKHFQGGLESGMDMVMKSALNARQGQEAALKNALMQLQIEQLPKELQSQINLRTAQEGKAAAEAGLAQADLQMLQDYLSRGQGGMPQGQMQGQMQGQPQQMGGGMQPGSGNPMAQLQGMLGGGEDPAMMRFNKRMYGQLETPGQKRMQDLQMEQAKNQINLMTPTSATQSRRENVMDITVPLFKSVEDLFDNFSQQGKVGLQRDFPKILDATAQRLMVFENYLGNNKSAEEAKEILTPSVWDTKESYMKRIRRELQKLSPQVADYYKDKGQPVPDEVKDYLEGGKYSKKGQNDAGSPEMVIIIDPKGVRRKIPAEMADQAIAAGGRRG